MYTPRKFRVHPTSSNIAMIETDHNAFTEATKTERRKKMVEVSCLLGSSSANLVAELAATWRYPGV